MNTWMKQNRNKKVKNEMEEKASEIDEIHTTIYTYVECVKQKAMSIVFVSFHPFRVNNIKLILNVNIIQLIFGKCCA